MKMNLGVDALLSLLIALLDRLIPLLKRNKETEPETMQTTIYVVVTPHPVESGVPTIPMTDLPKLMAQKLGELDLPGWTVKEVR